MKAVFDNPTRGTHTRKVRITAGISAFVVTLVSLIAPSVIAMSYERSACYSRTHFVTPPTMEEILEERKEREEQKRISAGGDFYRPLRIMVDYPGVTNPPALTASQVAVPDSTAIIGIERSGDALAVPLSALKHPKRHVLNLMVDETPVSITYCDLKGCVRVFSRDGASPIPLRIGGLDIDNQLVLLMDGQRYGQESKDIPLNDIRFEQTSWAQWKARYPETHIYLGDVAPEQAF